MKNNSTIQLSVKVKKQLDKIKISSSESYNNVIEYLLEDYKEVNEQTKRDIEEALEDVKAGRVISQKELEKEYGL